MSASGSGVCLKVQGVGFCVGGQGCAHTPPHTLGTTPPTHTHPGHNPPDTHTHPGHSPDTHNGQQAGGTHPTGMLSYFELN